MSRFQDIDPKLEALANRLGARLTKDRPSYPEVLRTFEERRIDWVDQGVFKALIIQPKFESGEINQQLWNVINLAWADFNSNGQRPVWEKVLIREEKFEVIDASIDSLLAQSERNLVAISMERLKVPETSQKAYWLGKSKNKETSAMEQSEPNQNPAFLEYVYQLTAGTSLTESLQQSLQAIDAIDMAHLNRIGLQTYEEGKWTIHQMLQHLIDWERIWCFRAVIFARAEGTIPVAHDQEIMAANCNANERSIQALVNELRVVRQSTILLFESFNQAILETTCRFFEYEMPLHAIGLTITAHQIHHFNVIEERYSHLGERS